MYNEKLNSIITSLAESFARQKHLPELRTRLKQEFPGDIYRQMIVYQRSRHNTSESERWQGRSEYEPAVSRYPNILAELDASGWWMNRIAKCAEVSPAIMAAVMEANGCLRLREMGLLRRCFGCGRKYLFAPVLSMVDPATNKGKARIWHLKDLLRQTEGMDRFFYQLHSSDVLPQLESGKPVTYAAYRWACRNLQEVLNYKARDEAQQRRTRTKAQPEAKGLPAHKADLATRLRQARERDKTRETESRLAEIRKYVDDTKPTIGHSSSKDLLALAEFAKRDMCGALLLAILYGRAQGNRAARGEVAV